MFSWQRQKLTCHGRRRGNRKLFSLPSAISRQENCGVNLKFNEGERWNFINISSVKTSLRLVLHKENLPSNKRTWCVSPQHFSLAREACLSCRVIVIVWEGSHRKVRWVVSRHEKGGRGCGHKKNPRYMALPESCSDENLSITRFHNLQCFPPQVCAFHHAHGRDTLLTKTESSVKCRKNMNPKRQKNENEDSNHKWEPREARFTIVWDALKTTKQIHDRTWKQTWKDWGLSSIMVLAGNLNWRFMSSKLETCVESLLPAAILIEKILSFSKRPRNGQSDKEANFTTFSWISLLF